MIPFQYSLKTRILFVTGSIILLIMMIVSLAILYQWRKILIEKKVSNAQSIADAFTVPALDALIYAEQRELLKDDLLETYIDNFIVQVKNIEYIIIYDTNNEIIAGKDRNVHRIDSVVLKDSLNVSNEFQSIIRQTETYGWIMEVNTPLEIGNKFWGNAKIGFDAEPIREEIKDIFLVLFSLTIFISIATLTVLSFLINRITFSLHKLVLQIDKIDFENIEEFKTFRSKDEIGFLVERFDDLLKRLKKSKAQLAIAQRQVYQSEKLASIGRLASGIAHEINNPLNGIKNCIYAIKKEPDNVEQTKEYIDLADEGIFYIENVIKKLLGL
jgi:two-component system, NtrC family, sensor kinase